MNSSRLLWRSAGLAALISTIVLTGGFIFAVKDIVHPMHTAAIPKTGGEQAAPAAKNPDAYRIIALGDSLTRGTGDGTGKGYVRNVESMLKKSTGKPVNVIGNYSVNGYRTDQLLNDLTHMKSIVEQIKQANIILLTIGGNDLFQMAQSELDLASEVADANVLSRRLPEPAKGLESILTLLAKTNPNAAIVYVGLYNPFYDLDQHRQGSLVVREWNDLAFNSANRFPNITVVPTFDLFQQHINDYLSSDHFHPNDTGYVRIAERVVQALQ